MNKHSKLLRSTGIISLATFGSRILGLLRDSLIGTFLPAGFNDAFVTAFRIPSTLRELFAEGALSAAFVPTFTEVNHNKGREEADKLAGSVFRLLFFVVLGVCSLGILLAPVVVRILLMGRTGNTDFNIFPVTTILLRVMFPYLLLISLAAVNMGLLHSIRRFGIPACSPILLNISIILCLLMGVYYWKYTGQPLAICLAIGVLIGGSLQLLSQWILAIKLGYLRNIFGPLWHPETGQILKLMVPRIMGFATTQLSMFLNTIFASFLWTGSIFVLWSANRLFQFPLGVAGIALSTATFPQLASDVVSGDYKTFHNTLRHSLRTMFAIMLPAAVGLIIIGLPLVDIIFNRGEFKEQGLLKPTYFALVGYTIGLVGHSGAKLVASAFFALKDTLTPVKVSISSLFVNAIVCIIAMQYLGPSGLALGTSVGALFNFTLLCILLKKKTSEEFLRDLSVYRIFISVIFMAIGIGLLVWFVPWPGGSEIQAIYRIIVGLISGLIIYILALRFFLPEEYFLLKEIVVKSRK